MTDTLFSNCYCASNLDANTRAAATQGAYDRPCPGNPSEFCGGLAQAGNSTALRFRRDVPSTYLLTVYADLTANEPPAQPPAIGPPPVPTSTAVVVVPGRTQSIAVNVDVTLTLDLECNCYKTSYPALPMATGAALGQGQNQAQSQADAAEAEATITVPVIPVEVANTLTTATSVLTKAITLTNAQQLSEVQPADVPQETGAADAVNQPQGLNQTTPSTPTTARIFTYQPPTGQPIYVTADAWSGWKEVKTSALLALAVAVCFALLL